MSKSESWGVYKKAHHAMHCGVARIAVLGGAWSLIYASIIEGVLWPKMN